MLRDDASPSDQHTLYKEIHPPTGVTHCCQAFFTHPAAGSGVLPNLVVVRCTLLQIYSVRTSGGDEETAWLERVAELSLAGVVESLALLQSRAPGVQRDAILLTFRDAKLVALDWDELAGCIITSSLHSFERDAQLRNGRSVFPQGPRVLTDPQGRCAAVLIYQQHVALLPSIGTDGLDVTMEAGPLGGRSLSSTLGSSYTVNLSKFGIKEVRDANFLHRYNEPVLLVLHESKPAWVGSLADNKDTMCLTAFSLNLAHQRHPKLWHTTDLPSDAHRLIPVPIGGALVLCQSLVLYHSQNVSCGLAVSSSAYAGVAPPLMDFDPMREPPSATAARHARKFATNVAPEAAPAASKGIPRAEGFDLDLQGSTFAWLTPNTVLLGLASCELVLLNLEVRAGSVGHIRLSKANEAPRSSCACRLGQGLVFLGSWVGDSLLLHASPDGHKKKPLQLEGSKTAPLALPAPETTASDENGGAPTSTATANGKGGEFNLAVGVAEDAEEDDFAQLVAEEEPPAKRQRLEEVQAGALGDKDEEEAPVSFHSTETARLATIATGFSKFSFKVVDSLLGLGPVRNMTVGEVVSSAPPEWASGQRQQQTALQLVACTGHGRSGALAVLRRSLLPEPITEVPLAGVRGLWAVRFWPEGLPYEEDFAWHAFLLLSTRRETKVLQTGEELNEMQASQVDFALDTPTLLAANLLSWARTVQVCPDKVLLLAGSARQSVTTVHQLVAPPESPTGVQGEKAAAAAQPINLAGVQILAASAADPYVVLHLSNGSAALLCGSLETGRLDIVQAARPVLQEVPASDPSAHITACALYADRTGWLASVIGAPTTVFLVVCSANGLLQVFSLSDMELVFDHKPVTEGSGMLSGDPEAEAAVPKDSIEEDGTGDGDADFVSTRPVVVEVRMESFASALEVLEESTSGRDIEGPRMPCEKPVLLMLLSDGGLLAYRGFAPPGGGVRFARLPLDWSGHSGGWGAHGVSSRMVRFDGLGEGALTYSGVFISGARPLWLVAARGTLVVHPMDVGTAITSMTPFNNINCPQGFITAHESGESAGALSIAQMPVQVRLDTPWPLQKIALRATPHQLAFLPEHRIYALLISRPVPYTSRLPEEQGGDTVATYSYAAADAAAKESGTDLGAQLRLVRPGTWTTAWRYALQPGEEAVCVHALALTNTQTGAQQSLVAVGTAQQLGEDYPCTGRVLFFEVSRGQADSDTALEAWEGKLLYSREFQGPVMSLAAVDGALLVAYGARLEIHRWTGSRLETMAFHDAAVLVTSISVIKRFVAVGDVHMGVSFLQVANDNRHFNDLSKDFDNVDVLATEFLINGTKLFILAADAAANLRLFAYQPDHPQSWAGKRLVSWGVVHTGHDVGDVVFVRAVPAGETAAPRSAVLGALDGSQSCMMPIWSDVLVQPLRALQKMLQLAVPHAAGLNPYSFRRRYQRIPKALGGGQHFGRASPASTILDGDLLWQFQQLPHTKQAALAQKLGMERITVLNLLDNLARAISVF